jgi:hypothetical protein
MSTTITPRHFTYDEMARARNALESADDLAGYWYAFGRLDQGHAPVAAQLHAEDHPSATSSAWLFGSMWMAMQREFRDNDHPRGHAAGMEPAWENFAKSGGRTLDRE